MKEAAGAVTGDEDKKAEGQAQQRKGAAGEEAAQKAKTQANREGSQRSREGASGLTPNERTTSAYATAVSSIVACSYSDGLR